jgi:hypothetical protein
MPKSAMTSDKNIFDRYLLALRKTPIDEKTEHTDRAALQDLLQAISNECGSGIAVQHEPKRIAEKGAPDFKITKSGLILGYVENKAIGEHLDKVLKSDQIKRYKSLSQNIIVTDYLHFIWINKDGIQRETLCHATDLESSKFRLREDRIAAVNKLLEAFFSTAPEGIGRAQQLALALATRSKLLRDYLGDELVRQEREHKEGRLYGLFQIFRDQVFHELTLKEFADAFAQMLAYGLFLARLNADTQPITLHNAREFVPGSFRLIRELVDFLTELEKDEYRDVRWVVEEVLSIVNALDLPAIHADLSFRQRKAINPKVRAADEEEHRLFERDPFIYFYEDFLKAYNPAERKRRGVYYTPPPIVNFIVRAVDDVLRDTFNINEGLADSSRVTVLDFACGTGTFLLEVFQRIFENIGGPESSRANLIVREHMLQNIYGFEYLIAPYTIAHLKLSQFLKDKGFPPKDNERLQVFLTNTLEPIEPQATFLLPAITAEVKAAQAVKEKRILVITGNPPYFGLSKNKGPEAIKSIDRYKYVDGVHFGERKHWLMNDYVKFLAFAQRKMDNSDDGIVAAITDNSYLDNPTFRGMRQSLLTTFNQIYIIDLHGNVEKRETPPSGQRNENVFDIKQGVSICLFVKKHGLPRGVWHLDRWGSRQEKYEWAARAEFRREPLEALSPTSPYYFFKTYDETGRLEYDRYYSVDGIFNVGSIGITTSRDGLVVAKDVNELADQIKQFLDSRRSDEDVKIKFSIDDNENWSVSKVRAAMFGESFDVAKAVNFLYGPYDIQRLYLEKRLVFRPRYAITNPMLRANIALLTTKIARDDSTVFVACVPAGHKAASRYDPSYIFPLFTYGINVGAGRQENLSPDFRAFLDARYDHHYTPEEILGYIYAVLNAPTYRTRYAEFLRINFPRIPFPESADNFESLSKLGWALVEAHLLREVPQRGLAAYLGKGDHKVEAVTYSLGEKTVSINKTQCFRPVPQAVWDFYIGGYQVLDKYLKSRRGRALSLDEINHVSAIADSLAFTIEQMAKIDKAYQATFAERG